MAKAAPLSSLGSLFGRIVRPRRVPLTRNLGEAGFRIVGGFVQEKERSPELAQHQSRYRLYADLLANVSIIAAGVRHFISLVGGAEWQFKPVDDSEEAMRYADLARVMLTEDPETPWHRIVRRASMYRFYGFSVQEWTLRRAADGHLTLADVAPRPQSTIERWDVEPDGTVVGCIQRSEATFREIYLPRSKVLYIVDDTVNDTPAGLGIFRHLTQPGQSLKRYQELEGLGYERDLRGSAVVRMPTSYLDQQVAAGLMTDEKKKKMEKEFEEFGKSQVKNPRLAILLDSLTYETKDEAGRPSNVPLWDIELLKGESTSFGEIAAAIERLNREMARVMGVEQLMLGSSTSGSYALSQDKTETFFLLVEGALTEIREGVKKDLLEPLWAVNGFPPEMMPQPSTQAIRVRDVQEIASTLRDLAVAGVPLLPDDPAYGETLDKLGLSRPESGSRDDVDPQPDEGDDDPENRT